MNTIHTNMMINLILRKIQTVQKDSMRQTVPEMPYLSKTCIYQVILVGPAFIFIILQSHFQAY
jgi:hypothetical protein